MTEPWIWCKNPDCGEAAMIREEYDNQHDVYRCPVCGYAVEVDKERIKDD